MSADTPLYEDADSATKPRKHKKRKHRHSEDGEQKHKRRRDANPDENDETTNRAVKKEKKHKHKHKHKHSETAASLSAEDNNSVPSSLSQSVDKSPFVMRTTAFRLPLSPVFQAGLPLPNGLEANEDRESHLEIEGLCAEHLSPLISTYVPALKGVLLAYENARLIEDPSNARADSLNGTIFAIMIDEYSSAYIWVAADFVLLSLRRDAEIDGVVTIQQENFISLICWNMYTASIERKYLPREWRWEAAGSRGHKQNHDQTRRWGEGDGQWVDADGMPVAGLLRFRVRDVELGNVNPARKRLVSLNIEGSLLTQDEERDIERPA